MATDADETIAPSDHAEHMDYETDTSKYSLFYISALNTSTDAETGLIEDFGITYETYEVFEDSDGDGFCTDEVSYSYDTEILSESVINSMVDGDDDYIGVVPMRVAETGLESAGISWRFDIEAEDWDWESMIPTVGVTGLPAARALIPFVDEANYVFPLAANKLSSYTGDTANIVAYRSWDYAENEKEALKAKFRGNTVTEVEEAIAAYSFDTDDEVMRLVLAALGNFSEPVFNFKKRRSISEKDLSIFTSTDVTEASVTVSTSTVTTTTEY